MRLRRVGGLLATALGELVIVAGLAGLPALFFWRVFFGDPAELMTFVEGDFTELHYPYRVFVASEYIERRLPLWTPYVSSGHSALGDIQHAIFYPIGLLFLLVTGVVPSLEMLQMQVIAHFALAGIFTYLLGRRMIGSRLGALVAALAFTYGGYLTSFPVQQMIILQVSVWLPLILLLLDLAVDWRSPALAVAGGLALATAALAGHPQTLAYVLAASLIFLGYRSWDRGVHISQPLIGLVFLVVGFGVAAPQLLPAYEHLQLTDRGAVDYQFTTHGFVFREMVGLILPQGFGGGSLYHGIATLVLASLAWLDERGGRMRALWASLAILALLFSFGGNTFLQGLLHLGMPPLRFRNHERFVFLIGFALAFLAGHGAAALSRAKLSEQALQGFFRALAVALVALAALSALFLYGSVAAELGARSALDSLANRTLLATLLLALSIGLVYVKTRGRIPRLWPVLVIAMIVFDLFSAHWQQNLRPVPPDEAFPTGRPLAYLQHNAFGLFRVSSEGLLPTTGNAGDLYRIHDTVGNSPLEVLRYREFERGIDPFSVLQLLNVRFILTQREFDPADGRFDLLVSEDGVNLYEIKPDSRLPRAWVARQTVFADSDADALARLDRIDYRNAVVVQDEDAMIDRQGATGLAEARARDKAGFVQVLSHQPGRLHLTASLPEEGMLVLSEIYHPDWAAMVDGEPVRIHQVNYALRGIRLNAGSYEIVMVFTPPSLIRGRAIATIVLQAAGLLLIVEVLVRLSGAFLLPFLGRRSPQAGAWIRSQCQARRSKHEGTAVGHIN